MPRDFNEQPDRLEDIYPDKKGENILGRAGVKTNFREEGYNITLNQELFGTYQEDSLWAGVIMHEAEHNFGYNHSKQNEKFDGSYIYEAGWCLERENSDKSFGLDGVVRSGIVIGD